MKTPNFATKTPEKVHKPTDQRANKKPIQNPENLENSIISTNQWSKLGRNKTPI